MKENIYVFQWVSDLGGADTRLKELLILIKDDFNITLIPNDENRLKEKNNTDFLDKIGAKYCAQSNLPKKLDGYAYANCNFRLFSEKHRINFIKDSGLKFMWSNDMMWHSPEELSAIKNGLVDVNLYTSPFHRSILHAEVIRANRQQKTFIIENYFDSDSWPLLNRERRPRTNFGKISRDDLLKFGENFPIFYEQVTDGLDVNFTVLGWSDAIDEKYSWYKFDNRWRMYAANAFPTIDWFLDLDVFLYNCNHRFIENQSRAIIESQLTGAPVIAPKRWNFPFMIPHGDGGCVYESLEEAKEFAKKMCFFEERVKAGKIASEKVRSEWCNKIKSLDKWKNLINFASNRGNNA